MIRRTLEKALRAAARNLPVVTLTGPRQSGKTTLARAVFRKHEYVSLEEPDHRRFAVEDPRGFLAQFERSAILDEVQRTPGLFSYIQTLVDEDDRPGRFILTGSQNFLLLQTVSQTLAGRCTVLNLLPFSLAELTGRSPLPLASLGTRTVRKPKPKGWGLFDALFTGFYPRIHDKKLKPLDWLPGYYQTYVERDVRNVLNVGDIEAFGRFIRLCAGRNGQLLNLSSLASDAGITHTTARRWLSVLEASFLVTVLRPHFRNFNKRMIKSPKLYFLDTGLLCFLLGVRGSRELLQHSMRGHIFESFVVSELMKNFIHRGESPPLFFWRDSAGHEVDLLIDLGERLVPVEIKSGETVASDFFDGLKYWMKLSRRTGGPAALIHGGDRHFKQNDVVVYPWFSL